MGREPVVGAGVELGSFRDPDSRVYITDGGVFRVLSTDGLEDWRALESTGLLSDLTTEGKLVGTRTAEVDELPALLVGEAAAALRHERVPVISYPYEWTFSMLKDAALLQLELNQRALAARLALKDASPYNVQWVGAEPVFIDVGSFERLRPGEPWIGYRQFCMLFLYPLMLQAYRDLPFHALLRGSVDGIEPAAAAAVLARGLGRLRKGVLGHVVLHARMARRHAGEGGREVKRELRRAGFDEQLLAANFRRMEKLVRRLDWRPAGTAWTGYGADNTYSGEDAEAKAQFVREAAGRHEGALVWDVGCNDGTYSRVAAESARYVVAFDADHATVDRLYRALAEEGRRDILPLVASVTDPSPNLGWRGLERSDLERRAAPDLVLCLALVHHVTITGNVPVSEFLDWLYALGAAAVVEFPHRDDPMVERLLAGKRDGAHPDYDLPTFDRLLRDRFDVDGVLELRSGTRTLYEVRPRSL